MHVRMIDPTSEQYQTWPPEELRASWLPKLGPTSFLLGVMLSELHVGEYELDDSDWAFALGVSESVFRQAAKRLANFNLGVVLPEGYVFATRWTAYEAKVNHFRKVG